MNEKQIKKLEVILKPEEYHAIFSQHATIYKLGDNVENFDWKADILNTIKPTGSWHFSFSQSKRFFITKNGIHVLVRGESTYRNELGVANGICKRGKKFTSVMPSRIEKRNSVKEEKKRNIESLLTSHYGEDWRGNPDLKFYKYVLSCANNEEIDENILCESVENCPDLLI